MKQTFKFKPNYKTTNLQNGIIVSDPMYDDSVWCRFKYPKSMNKWFCDVKADTIKEKFMEYEFENTNVTVFIARSPELFESIKISSEKDEENQYLTYNFPSNFVTKDYTIGVDSASLAITSNDWFNEMADAVAIDTMSDGYYGGVTTFKEKGRSVLSAIFIHLSFNPEDMCCSAKEFEAKITQLIEQGFNLVKI